MLKKTPCSECNGNGFVSQFTEYSVVGKKCSACNGLGYVEVPQTNADRIRAMSDEELADYWMKCACVCDWCALKAKCDEDTISKDRCIQGVREWLKQPAAQRWTEARNNATRN